MTRLSTEDMLPVKRAGELEVKTPEQRFLVESLWLDDSVGIIGGFPKSGKTWAGLDLAISVASGSPCLGHFPVGRRGPTMVYLAEDALPMVRERLLALCTQRGIRLEDLDLHVITAPRLRLDVLADQARLRRTLQHYQPRLLLLDPFVRLHSRDENQSQEVTPLLDYLRELQRTLSLSIVLVHHMRKNGSSSQQGQALRGSGDIHAWLDCAWYITHEKGRLKLTVEHRSAPAPEPFHLKLVTTHSPHLKLVDAPAPEEPSLEERVHEVLSGETVPLTRTQLRQRIRVNNARLGEALKALTQQGRIRRTETGYVL
ncbi:MAG TPA: AAA family ATPase [Anaerolineae bacterium]|nr:AAA family ATPase [Anaerolineae bacterium]